MKHIIIDGGTIEIDSTDNKQLGRSIKYREVGKGRHTLMCDYRGPIWYREQIDSERHGRAL